MTIHRTLLLAAVLSLAPTAMTLAQTTPQNDPTSPSAASSQHQRDATSSNAAEAPPTDQTEGNRTDPAAASTPHQRLATRTASKQSMKECVAKQKADHSAMSTADAKKACTAQMKGPG